MEAVGGLIVVIGIGMLYFAPLLIARSRQHHQTMAIGLLNLFLGWTILGWTSALILAFTAVRPPPAPPTP
jgi:Superinfection immunity protein